MPDATTDPFTKALTTLVQRDPRFVTRLGSINWSTFAKELPTIHYETLRKILVGERALDERAIEEVAAAAGVDPTYFAEYRLMKARDLFDPRQVGFDAAISNLQEWFNGPQQGSREASGRRRRRRT